MTSTTIPTGCKDFNHNTSEMIAKSFYSSKVVCGNKETCKSYDPKKCFEKEIIFRKSKTRLVKKEEEVEG